MGRKGHNITVLKGPYKAIKEYVEKTGLWSSPTQFYEESARIRLLQLKREDFERKKLKTEGR